MKINFPSFLKSQLFRESQKLASTLNLIFLTLGLLTAGLVVRYQIDLLSYLKWEDESETIVAAKMLAAGKTLYSEVFNHHGPLIFLSGYVLELIGNYGIVVHRIPIIFLQWLALAAIFACPLLPKKQRAPYFIISSAVLTLYMPILYGHMYLYQTVAGLFCVILLSQFVLPVLINPNILRPFEVAIGVILISCLPFLAITYLPVAALFLIASCRKDIFRQVIFWCVIGTTSNLLVLAWIGSYPGFLVDHLYINSRILPLYNGVRTISDLIKIAFNSFLFEQNFLLIFLEIIVAIMLIHRDKSKYSWRSICILIAVGSFFMRGIEMHSIPFYYSLIAMTMVLFLGRIADNLFSLSFFLIIAVGCVYKISIPLDADKNTRKNRIPTQSEFSNLAKKVTNRDDKIIVYSFRNTEYILSDRLPASGNFFLLPMQVKYNEDPKLGIKIDSCKDIEAYRPKLMYIDKWKFWEKYEWTTYGECIDKIIRRHYVQIPDKPFYLRRDVAEAHPSEFK